MKFCNNKLKKFATFSGNSCGYSNTNNTRGSRSIEHVVVFSPSSITLHADNTEDSRQLSGVVLLALPFHCCVHCHSVFSASYVLWWCGLGVGKLNRYTFLHVHSMLPDYDALDEKLHWFQFEREIFNGLCRAELLNCPVGYLRIATARHGVHTEQKSALYNTTIHSVLYPTESENIPLRWIIHARVSEGFMCLFLFE